MSRNLVVCLDGTRNEPETGATKYTAEAYAPSLPSAATAASQRVTP